MAVKIRLMRVGKKKQPSYRVVVADERSPRDGRIIESIGQYAPRAEPSIVSLDTERAVHWLRHGAQPTEQTAKLLEIAGVWDAYKQATGKDAAAKPKPKAPRAKKSKAEPEPPKADVASDAPAAEAPAADAPAAEEPAGSAAVETGEETA